MQTYNLHMKFLTILLLKNIISKSISILVIQFRERVYFFQPYHYYIQQHQSIYSKIKLK